MFDIMRALGEQGESRFAWEDEAAAELEIARVCKYSGYRLGPNCLDTQKVLVLKNAHPNVECPFHKRFIIEKKTGFRANPWKRYKKGELEDRITVVYPAQVQKVIAGKGKEPELGPSFKIVEQRPTLQVTSPVDGGVYIIPLGVRNAGTIPLQGFTSTQEEKIYWFVNDRYRGITASGEVMEIEPEGSQMKIVAQDESGISRVVKIIVEQE